MYHISKDKRSYKSSKMIYDSLVELVLEKNYEKIKVNELCERAKIGRTTFYRHYDTIDDVLRMEVDNILRKFKKYCIEYKREHPTSIGFFKPLLRFFYVHPTILKIIFKSKRSNILQESMYYLLSDLNTIKKSTNNEYLNIIRVSIIIGVLEKWTEDGMNILPDNLVESVKDSIISAIV